METLSWYQRNKEKVRVRSALWKKENADRVRRTKARWRITHKLVHRKHVKKWYEKNKKKKTDYLKDKYRTDARYRVSVLVRARMSKFIRSYVDGGNRSIGYDIGIDKNGFINYLEKSFSEGMSFSNYGKQGWCIDHVVPLADFDLEKDSEFAKAVHYTNMKPVWIFDNLQKGVRKVSLL